MYFMDIVKGLLTVYCSQRNVNTRAAAGVLIVISIQ